MSLSVAITSSSSSLRPSLTTSSSLASLTTSSSPSPSPSKKPLKKPSKGATAGMILAILLWIPAVYAQWYMLIILFLGIVEGVKWVFNMVWRVNLKVRGVVEEKRRKREQRELERAEDTEVREGDI